jgi:hypothetical protein
MTPIVNNPRPPPLPEKKRRMELRFDRNTYSFAEPASPHTPIATDCLALLGEVEAIGERWSPTFNDLSCYLLLRAQDGCTMVELSYIDIYHSSGFCMGLQVTYRSKFSNGSTSLSSASTHCYNSGFYSYHGGHMQVSRLTFGDGEYLAEVRTRQGEITDQITFLTNLRTVSFGGNGGTGEDMSLPVNQKRRIVAFIGCSRGVLGRLGAISISYNWVILGPIVLLFELVERHRASSVAPLKTCFSLVPSCFSSSHRASENSRQLTNEAVQVLLEMRRGYKHLFRRTLLFLVAGKKHAGQDLS